MKKTIPVFTLTIITLTSVAFAGPPTVVWNNTYESGGFDQAQGVATDAAGNAYVTGYYGDLGVAAACRTIKYDPDGNILWNKLYDENDVDAAYDIAVDGSGNVYVAGFAVIGSNPDYLLIKYNSDGDQLWVETWGTTAVDMAYGVAADASGNAYITGYTYNGANVDFRTIKYDPGGSLQWGQSYDESGHDDVAYGAAVDGAGNVYVAGLTFNGANEDFLTVKYDRDGNILWSDVRDENFNDFANGIAVDAAADVYVGGGSEDNGGADIDFFTVKYDSDGNFQWKKRFDDDNGNYACGIAVDQFFVYLTGITFNSVDPDFLTIRYDKEGNLGWEKNFDSGSDDIAYDLAVDPSHYVYVTGFSIDGSDFDFRTIKYAQDDIPAVEETRNPSSLSLETAENFSSTITLRYSLPAGTQGSLTFYSADGRKIESCPLDPSQSTFTWPARNTRNTRNTLLARNTPSGVYFARLDAGNKSAQVKFCLIK